MYAEEINLAIVNMVTSADTRIKIKYVLLLIVVFITVTKDILKSAIFRGFMGDVNLEMIAGIIIRSVRTSLKIVAK